MRKSAFLLAVLQGLVAHVVSADQQEPGGPSTRDPLVHLPLDEGKGEYATDHVSGRTMQVFNGEWSIRPATGNGFSKDDKSYESTVPCVRLNGVNAYIEVDKFSRETDDNQFSVSAWIKPENVNPKSVEECGAIVSQNSGNHSGFTMTGYYQAGLCAMVVTEEGHFTATAENVLRAGEWQEVGFSWDGELLQLYVDGAPVGTAAITSGKFVPCPGPLHIGKAVDRDSQYFTGEISEVRINGLAMKAAKIEGLGDPIVKPATEDLNKYGDRKSRHVKGRNRSHPPLVDFSQDFSNWTCTSYSGVSEGSLFSSSEQQLWGDSAAKIAFRGGKYEDKQLKKVVLTPPSPIPIEKDFNAVDIWVYASYWGEAKGAKISLQIRQADGRVRDVAMESREFPFAFWSGWFLWHRNLQEPIISPGELVSLTIFGFEGKKEETIFLDSIAFSNQSTDPLKSNVPEWKDCNFPDTADTILPYLSKNILFKNSVRKNGNAFLFSYEGTDEKFEYSYTPRTGTLEDLHVLHSGKSYGLGKKGGWIVEIDGKVYDPESTEVKRTLERCELRNDTVRTRWKISVGDRSFFSEMNISIKQKSLIVEANADGGFVKGLVCGGISGGKSPALTQVPYLVLRGSMHESQDPSVFSENGTFISCFLDWYSSSASELYGRSRIVNDMQGPIAEVNGGSVYYPTTAGKRNPAFEKIFFTVSKKFDEILPNIPNPPNRWLETTKSAVWATRMWYVDKLPYSKYYEEELDFWKKLHSYGVTNIFLRQHVTVYRQYADNKGDPYTLVTDSEPGLGGDQKLAEFFHGMQEDLGYRCALYTNYTLVDPLSVDVWENELVALLPDGDWRYGSLNAALLKPSRVLPLQKIFNPELKKKFNPTASYLDQFTCRPLWGHTDYDQRVEGAGKFSPVLRVFGNALQAESDQFDGPVLSEGICQWMLSGLCDSYAQPGDAGQDTLVNFQLGKMHLLSNDCGYHLQVVASENPADVDNLISAEIAYGNIGVIFGVYGGPPPKEVPATTLKSYFMIQQLQEFYANVPVAEIRYHLKGKLETIEKAISENSLKNNQIYVKYQNGLEVFVNRNPTSEWLVTHQGKTYLLPPYGHVCTLAGRIEQYSALQDGRRIDYVRGGEYLFCSAGGKVMDFGPIKSAQSYALRWSDGNSLTLTPAPFVGEERVLLKPAELLPGLAGKIVSVVPYDAKGMRGEPVHVDLSETRGVAEVAVKAGIRRYAISQLDANISMK